ncbi:SAM-dependent methyltransferase [Sphingorhabdus lutea]|uniref:SAM-dependent methyltransferase n=1 Tax=Sphingorhabdus lutea TaxID=1913578 RepID=A0A1L3JBJ7_9SPHN|nr:cyclopropane-fatty-acyl-phospholipid synthase family protein [Sphingorhabdus lutea]APG62515.1 SAM-dependent methyltransferase [Sphingorhabdus lutea]
MSDSEANRGGHLVKPSGRILGALGLSGLIARPISRIIANKIDTAIIYGSIDAMMPDGSQRQIRGQHIGPHAIIHLHDWRALVRLVRGGSVGWYEAWEDGQWSSPDPVKIFDIFLRNRATLGQLGRAAGMRKLFGRFFHWLNRNNQTGSKRNIQAHYDLGNDFYKLWLDESLSYSSALFDGKSGKDISLFDAQNRKNDRILEQIKIKNGQSILEIGCGWGGFAKQAFNAANINYHGITLSAEQAAIAREKLSILSRQHDIKNNRNFQISLTDYRDVDGQYDAIVSVEMVEAVGQKYWPSYMQMIARNLKSSGRAVIQYIGIDDAIFEQYSKNIDFIQAYIFPGGLLISQSKFRALAMENGLIWEDHFEFGHDYATTLKIWRQNFDKADAAGKIPAGFDEKFKRLWRYYLMYCEGGFASGGIYVAQLTLKKS